MIPFIGPFIIFFSKLNVSCVLTLFLLRNLAYFLSSGVFFQYQPFKKIFQEYHHSDCQTTVRFQTRPDVSGLIWVQTVCQGYQQTKLAMTSRIHSTLCLVTQGNKSMKTDYTCIGDSENLENKIFRFLKY